MPLIRQTSVGRRPKTFHDARHVRKCAAQRAYRLNKRYGTLHEICAIVGLPVTPQSVWPAMRRAWMYSVALVLLAVSCCAQVKTTVPGLPAAYIGGGASFNSATRQGSGFGAFAFFPVETARPGNTGSYTVIDVSGTAQALTVQPSTGVITLLAASQRVKVFFVAAAGAAVSSSSKTGTGTTSGVGATVGFVSSFPIGKSNWHIGPTIRLVTSNSAAGTSVLVGFQIGWGTR